MTMIEGGSVAFSFGAAVGLVIGFGLGAPFGLFAWSSARDVPLAAQAAPAEAPPPPPTRWVVASEEVVTSGCRVVVLEDKLSVSGHGCRAVYDCRAHGVAAPLGEVRCPP